MARAGPRAQVLLAQRVDDQPPESRPGPRRNRRRRAPRAPARAARSASRSPAASSTGARRRTPGRRRSARRDPTGGPAGPAGCWGRSARSPRRRSPARSRSVAWLLRRVPAATHPENVTLVERSLIRAIESLIVDRSGRLARWTGDDAAVVRARPLAVTSIDSVADGRALPPGHPLGRRRGLEGAGHRAVRPGGDGRRGRRGLRGAGPARGTSRGHSSWWAAWRSSRRAAEPRSPAAT